VTRFGPDLVAQHLRLVNPLIGQDEIRAAVITGAPVSTIVTAARDRVRLLSTITGVLAVHNLAVLEARVVTRNDGIAIDTFRVSDALGSDMVGPGRWAAVRESLDNAMTGSLDLGSRLAEKRTAYRPAASTLAPEVRVHRRHNGITIDIRASDRVGLLHDISVGLADLGLEVELAKIDTRGTEAIDIFEAKNPRNHSDERIVATMKEMLADR
jgi:[protein-PII] uridylyltransferase